MTGIFFRIKISKNETIKLIGIKHRNQKALLKLNMSNCCMIRWIIKWIIYMPKQQPETDKIPFIHTEDQEVNLIRETIVHKSTEAK